MPRLRGTLHPLLGDTAVVGGLSLGGCHGGRVLVPLGIVVLPPDALMFCFQRWRLKLTTP